VASILEQIAKQLPDLKKQIADLKETISAFVAAGEDVRTQQEQLAQLEARLRRWEAVLRQRGIVAT